jgi:hypothetical protein
MRDNMIYDACHHCNISCLFVLEWDLSICLVIFTITTYLYMVLSLLYLACLFALGR